MTNGSFHIIDFHTHAFNEHLAKNVIPELEAKGHVKAVYEGTVQGLINSMEQAGISRAVIQPIATKATQVESINWWSRSIMIPDKIHCFGAIHPELSVEQILKTINFLKVNKFKGVKMHPEYQMFFPDEDRLEPIYNALQANDMVLLIHAGVDLCFSGEVKSTPERLLAVHKSFPDLKMITAHLGGFKMWDQVEKHLLGQSIWMDTAFCSDYCPKEQFERIVENHSKEKILFGSDAPWGDQKKQLDYILETNLKSEEKHRILGLNALQLI